MDTKSREPRNKDVKLEMNGKPLGWFEPRHPGQGKRNFAILPIQLLLDKNVNKTGLQVFAALATHADKFTGLCGRFVGGRYRTPSYSRLGAIVGLSRRSVQDGVANLETAGWIVRKKRRFDNTLVMWLGMPAELDLVNEYGAFKAFPDTWSDAEILDDERSDDDAVQELLDSAPRDEDGSIDLTELLKRPLMSQHENRKILKDKLGIDATGGTNRERCDALIEPGNQKPDYADSVEDVLRHSRTGVRIYSDSEVEKHGLFYGMQLDDFRFKDEEE